MSKLFYSRLAWSNIQKNRRFYLPYLLSAIGTIMMFYIIAALVPGISATDMYGGATVAATMALGQRVIAIFAVLFLFYTNSFIIKRRKKELGLYIILGMEKRHLVRIVFLETLYISLINIAGGLLAGILFSKLMFLLLGKLLAVSLPITFLIPASAIGATAALFACIFTLTLLYNLLQIIRCNPIDLLHGGNVGEKEPKANWFLALVGVACLGTGYTMAVRIEDPVGALTFFFVAVVLVIAGTYALFTAGITAFLKILKSRKRYYYRLQHFTTISGMLYRMKQNAAGLASICILSTCVLVMLSTTFSMFISTEDILDTRYPRDIGITVTLDGQTAHQVEDTIHQTLQDRGITPSNIQRTHYKLTFASGSETQFTTQEELGPTDIILQLMSLREYNETAAQPLPARENLAYVQHSNQDYAETTLILDGIPLETAAFETDLLDSNPYANRAYVILLPDNIPLDSVIPGRPATLSFGFDIEGLDDDALRDHATAIFTALASTGANPFVETKGASRQDFYALNGGFFFLGMFLGAVFLIALVMIIYYKQISEGYDDKAKFEIMQKVGMSRREVKRSIHSQIMLVFFLPLVTAVIHLAFALPMLTRILRLLGMTNLPLILWTTVGTVLVFAPIYIIVYLITARTYTKIVEA